MWGKKQEWAVQDREERPEKRWRDCMKGDLREKNLRERERERRKEREDTRAPKAEKTNSATLLEWEKAQ